MAAKCPKCGRDGKCESSRHSFTTPTEAHYFETSGYNYDIPDKEYVLFEFRCTSGHVIQEDREYIGDPECPFCGVRFSEHPKMDGD